MKKKAALSLGILVVLLLGLMGCQGGRVAEKYTDYVQGVMDCSYRGEFEQYMKSRGCDETEAQEVYDSTAENLAYNIMAYTAVDYEIVGDEIIGQYTDLAKQILMKADYTVNKAEKAGDVYHITVEIKPVDFFDIIYDEGQAYADEFNVKLEEMTDISDSQYEELEKEYAAGMLETITPYVDSMGYGDVKTKIVEIEVDDEGYGLADEDWASLDNMVVGLE